MNLPQRQQALALIAQFRNWTTATHWVNMPRSAVANQLEARVWDPTLISSKVVNQCGPAAFFYNWVDDDPEAYVRFAVGLYENDQAAFGSETVQDNMGRGRANLQASAVPRGMDAVDWLVMASLRTHSNLVLANNSGDDGLAGLTMPSGLAGWYRAVGYSSIINETNVYFNKDEAHIRRADDLRANQGYHVSLFINANMLDPTTQADSSWFPDHWVTLASRVTINSASGGGNPTISLSVHSWGAIMAVPQGTPLSLSDFLDNYYGFVAAKH